MGIASMILGICSLVFCWGWIAIIGIPCAIVGLILGTKAKNRGLQVGMAKAGIITSIIGLILGIIFLAIFIVVIIVAGNSYNYNYY